MRPAGRFQVSLVRATLLFAALVAGSTSAAELRFGAPFSDDMALQRGKPIPVWGWAAPGAAVELQLGDVRTTAKADADGRWKATFDARTASLEPLMLKASSGDEQAIVERAVIGDVWLCSGQSNMAMTLAEAEGGDVEIERAGERATLRLLSVPRAFAGEPKTDFDAAWGACSPDAAAKFSAVGYFFGAALLESPETSGVPIGLVDCSFGGTAAEAWISKESLQAFEKSDLLPSFFGIAPTQIHDGMIAPLAPFPVAGVLWYQGESNAGKPEIYARMLATLIDEWRREFNDPELPFFVVQLPRFSDSRWPLVREAQAECVEATPRTALAVTIDTTDGFDLHPKEKRTIGERLALAARRMVYGGDVVAEGPKFQKAVVEGDAIRIEFETEGEGLAIGGCEKELRGFALAGDDGVYRFAQAEIDGDSVVVRCDSVPVPKTVRYAWGAMPEANLANGPGLPAAPFRTDELLLSPIEIGQLLPVRRLATAAYEIEIAGDGRVTSLGVGGQQFLSNALGAAGGTSIPGFFGPRPLMHSKVLGPDLVSYRDNDVTLAFAFREQAMTWTLENRGTGAIQFRIALAPGVAVEEGAGPAEKKLRRGESVVVVSGVDAVEENGDARLLRFDVPGSQSKRIELSVPPR